MIIKWKWPGRNEYILSCSKFIVEGEDPVPVCILGYTTHPLLPNLMKEYVHGGSNEKEQFFGFKFSSARKNAHLDVWKGGLAAYEGKWMWT